MFYFYKGSIEMIIYNVIIWGVTFGLVLFLLSRYPSRWEREYHEDES